MKYLSTEPIVFGYTSKEYEDTYDRVFGRIKAIDDRRHSEEELEEQNGKA